MIDHVIHDERNYFHFKKLMTQVLSMHVSDFTPIFDDSLYASSKIPLGYLFYDF